MLPERHCIKRSLYHCIKWSFCNIYDCELFARKIDWTKAWCQRKHSRKGGLRRGARCLQHVECSHANHCDVVCDAHTVYAYATQQWFFSPHSYSAINPHSSAIFEHEGFRPFPFFRYSDTGNNAHNNDNNINYKCNCNPNELMLLTMALMDY